MTRKEPDKFQLPWYPQISTLVSKSSHDAGRSSTGQQDTGRHQGILSIFVPDLIAPAIYLWGTSGLFLSIATRSDTTRYMSLVDWMIAANWSFDYEIHFLPQEANGSSEIRVDGKVSHRSESLSCTHTMQQ